MSQETRFQSFAGKGGDVPRADSSSLDANEEGFTKADPGAEAARAPGPHHDGVTEEEVVRYAAHLGMDPKVSVRSCARRLLYVKIRKNRCGLGRSSSTYQQLRFMVRSL